MDTVDLIIKSSTEFYNDLKSDENGRYRSWEHCYSHFMNARGRNDVDYDYLSLQLAFYLASWGMYRGSSFLLQKDYSNAVMSQSWLDKYGQLIELDTRKKEELFKSISGQVEILGLSPNNDEHLFLLLSQNPKVKSVVYYYFDDKDRQEIPHHIKKPITYKKATKLWKSLEK